MFKQMLIPLDGSKIAEAVLPYARTFAERLELEVELLGVVDVGALAIELSEGRGRLFENMIAETVANSEAYLKRIAASFPKRKVKCIAERGKPEEVILERAVENTTLIAMATHGRSGLNRFLMGSVAEKVLRAATSPILLVRASEGINSDGEATLKSVLVPLDGSELAEVARPTVTTLAKELGLEIMLLRAYKVPTNVYTSAEHYYPEQHEEIRAMLRDDAQAYLEKQVAELKGFGIAKVSLVTREDVAAADAIMDVARTLPNNFIAMCTHGRTGVGRWVLGSVTETVVRHSAQPVLVIRAA